MNKSALQQIINDRIIELNATAEAKKPEIYAALEQQIAQLQHFLTRLESEKSVLEAQLSQSQAVLAEMNQTLDFAEILAEFEVEAEKEADDFSELSQKTEQQLQHAMQQQLNDWKIKSVSAQQDVAEKLAQAKENLVGKPSQWAVYADKLQARFGGKIQTAKAKLAAQLEACAVKLKA